MQRPALELRAIDESWQEPLAAFFSDLMAAGYYEYFHPHPLNGEEAYKRAHCRGQDLYYVLVEGVTVLGYGMLRGWDEGYDVPSLGIAIHPAARGTGLGRLFMHFLHAAAQRSGAKRIRLKVYPGNTAALQLYKSLGYRFEISEAGQLLGILDLA
jgi:ribosomal-protein-alanine N-acetyltransferase